MRRASPAAWTMYPCRLSSIPRTTGRPAMPSGPINPTSIRPCEVSARIDTDAVLGKEDVLDRPPRLYQPLAQFEGDKLEMGLEQIKIVGVQSREKTVANRCLLKGGHGSLPHGGKSASPLRPSLCRLRPRSSASGK